MSRTKAEKFAFEYLSVARVEFVRDLPCIVSRAAGACDNAHTRSGGVGKKACYDTIVPLAHEKHDELHRIGIRSFEKKYHVILAERAVDTERQWLAYDARTKGNYDLFVSTPTLSETP